MKKILLSLVFAMGFSASASHAGITLTIAGFNPASSSTAATKSAKSKGDKKEREKSKNRGGSKVNSITKSKNGASAGASNATLSVISSNFQAGTGGSSGRATNSNGADAYVITRNMDSRSSDIANAAQTGRMYPSAVIAGAGGSRINLNRAYLSSYSTSMSGGSSVETFKVHFQSQSVN